MFYQIISFLPQPLQLLLKKLPDVVPDRLNTSRGLLVILDTKGVDNVVADCLSRPPEINAIFGHPQSIDVKQIAR